VRSSPPSWPLGNRRQGWRLRSQRAHRRPRRNGLLRDTEVSCKKMESDAEIVGGGSCRSGDDRRTDSHRSPTGGSCLASKGAGSRARMASATSSARVRVRVHLAKLDFWTAHAILASPSRVRISNP
jgi:hypothetical protein